MNGQCPDNGPPGEVFDCCGIDKSKLEGATSHA